MAAGGLNQGASPAREASAAATAGSRRGRRIAAAVIGVASFCVYSMDAPGLRTADSIPNTLVPLAIALHGTTTLDPFRHYLGIEPSELVALRRTPGHPQPYYYLTPAGGHLHSSYPPALPVLLVPAHGAVALAVGAGDWSERMQVALALALEPVMAAAIAAGAAVVMFLLLGRVTSLGWAFVLTAMFAFGTSMWTTASKALWQQGPSTLFLLLALLAMAPPNRRWTLAGVWTALAVAVRPTNLVLLVAGLAVLLHRRRVGEAVRFAAPVLGAGVLMVAYNLMVFGDLRGGYAAEPFHADSLSGLAGLLLSPSRGLLIFAPALVFALYGVRHALRRHEEDCDAGPVALIFAALSLLLCAHLVRWWGGAAFGPRLLTESTAALVVLMAPAADWIRRSKLRTLAFAAAVVWGIAVQSAGAFCHQYDHWEGDPWARLGRERLWDWRENQIATAFRACFD